MIQDTLKARGAMDCEKGRAIRPIVNSPYWHFTKRVKRALKSPKLHGKMPLATGKNVTSKGPGGLLIIQDQKIPRGA